VEVANYKENTMAEEDTKYPGHEGTNKPPVAPSGYMSPGTHAPLSQQPQGVNEKTGLGKDGKA
jgi:hypothetical protein